MKRWVWIILIVLMLCLSLVGGLYQYGGLKYYLRAVGYVRKNPTTSESFYGLEKNKVYRGLLAGTWNNGVWVWGRAGLQYFAATADSTYSILKGCEGEITDNTEGFPTGKFLRSNYGDVKSWGDDLKVGDYVFVTYTDGLIPKADKVWGMDFWMFTNDNLKTQCTRGGA